MAVKSKATSKAAGQKPAVQKKKKGAPSAYNEELVAKILDGIAAGKSLYNVIDELGKPVQVSTVYDWLQVHPDFAERYTRARETQADTLADEIIAIADDSRGDTYIDLEGNERTNHENVQRSRLKVEARKWVAAKLKPKVYGDKIQVDAKVEMTDEQVNEKLAALMAKYGPKQD